MIPEQITIFFFFFNFSTHLAFKGDNTEKVMKQFVREQV